MAKIVLFLIICLAFELVNGSDTTQEVETNKPEVQQGSSESVEKDDSDRGGALSQAVAGGTKPYRSYPAVTQTPLLVECQVCTDCPHVTPDTPSKICPFTLDPNKRGRCVTYAEKYRHMQRPWYIRGCASERGTCEDIRKAHENHASIVSLLFCKECEGERCNTSGASTFTESTISFIVLIISPILTKFTMS